MIDSYYRAPLQKRFIDPIVNQIAKYKIDPSMLTLLALLFGLSFAPVYLIINKYLALLFLLTSGLFDILDGSLARKLSKSSPVGGMFDIVSDRTVEFIVVFTFFVADPNPSKSVWMLLLGSFYLCVTTFLVAGTLKKNNSNKSFDYSPGLIERSETFIFFTALIIFQSFQHQIAFVFATAVFLKALLRLKQYVRL